MACGGQPPPGAKPARNVAKSQNLTAATTLTATLTTAARRLAAANGDPNPTALRYVKSTRKAAALAISSAEMDTDQSVYVVELAGSFARSALGGKAQIIGGSMIVIVDAATGTVTDWGITRSPGGISALGTAAITL